jgi:SAM-dependent methyltransferase
MSTVPNYNEAKGTLENWLAHQGDIARTGAAPRAFDRSSETSQESRYAQLVKVIDPSRAFSLLDYGCGYGALADYIMRVGYPMAEYVGFDVMESMIAEAQKSQDRLANCTFTSEFTELFPVDYTIASGTFTLKLEVPHEEWTNYVLSELHKMNKLSIRGFSFNALSKYIDQEFIRTHLYYADPCYLFDYCKRNFGSGVALLHDYDLNDFTIIVRKTLR